METLIVEHRNQKSMGHHDRFRSGSSKTFRQINCRTFQSGVGLLPRPKRSSSSSTIPITTKGGEARLPQVQSPRSPKSVLPVFNPRTSPIPIPIKGSSQIRRCTSEVVDSKRRSYSYSELWAGPTYSNSPPPTSVPIPKFSLKQKRSVSVVSFPSPDSTDEIRAVATKSVSAPVSPTSSGDDSNNNPFRSTLSATITLRRMLNLETADESL